MPLEHPFLGEFEYDTKGIALALASPGVGNLLGTKFAFYEDVSCQDVDPPGYILCGCELWGHSRGHSDHYV